MQKEQQELANLIKGKKVAFIGAGVSHKTLIREFVELGAHVTLCDQKKSVEDFGDYAATIKELGIDLSHALRIPGGTTSTYLYLADPAGEMALAVSDMSICEKITPAYLASNLTILQNAQVIVADTNIPAEALQYLAENVTVPLFVDPVSTAKAEKLRPILHRIHTLKPNRLEAELLSGVKIESQADVEKAADTLTAMGVHRMFISLGADGVYAAMGKQKLWLA